MRRSSSNRKRLARWLALLARERLSWALSAFYFLTFGGFVAFSIYLPSLLRDQFHLQPADAGFRTAGFVVLGHSAATRRRMAFGPDRRGACAIGSLLRRDSFCTPARVAVNAALHNRCARLRCLDGLGEWRCVQTGSAVLSPRDGHRNRTRWSYGWPWRLLPASSARLL